MPAKLLPMPSSVRRNLLAQIAKLSDQQTSALKNATFGGMTDDEARKIDERRELIARLLKRLMIIQLREVPAESLNREVPADDLDLWSKKKAS